MDGSSMGRETARFATTFLIIFFFSDFLAFAPILAYYNHRDSDSMAKNNTFLSNNNRKKNYKKKPRLISKEHTKDPKFNPKKSKLITEPALKAGKHGENNQEREIAKNNMNQTKIQAKTYFQRRV